MHGIRYGLLWQLWNGLCVCLLVTTLISVKRARQWRQFSQWWEVWGGSSGEMWFLCIYRLQVLWNCAKYVHFTILQIPHPVNDASGTKLIEPPFVMCSLVGPCVRWGHDPVNMIFSALPVKSTTRNIALCGNLQLYVSLVDICVVLSWFCSCVFVLTFSWCLS